MGCLAPAAEFLFAAESAAAGDAAAGLAGVACDSPLACSECIPRAQAAPAVQGLGQEHPFRVPKIALPGFWSCAKGAQRTPFTIGVVESWRTGLDRDVAR